MIRLVCLAFSPFLAAVFCAHQAPEPDADYSVAVEIEDRQFLAAEDAREAWNAGRMERIDREFLAKLEANEPALVAIPVRLEMPVRRAISVQAAKGVQVAETVPVARAVSARVVPRAETVTRIEPAVRRATAVERRRASILIYGDEVVVVPTAALR